MEDLGKNIYKIPKEDLIETVMQMRTKKKRLAQICCSLYEGVYDVTYSFAEETNIQHIRVCVPEEETIPSIIRIYSCAIFYENEMRELFGLKVEKEDPNANMNLYRIDAVTPFAPKKEG